MAPDEDGNKGTPAIATTIAASPDESRGTPAAPASLARSTAVMTGGTILSRLTGLIRLAVIAGTLGIAESRLPDTYNLANTVPNIIYELVLGGVITSIFVPLFVELLEKEQRERAWEVISAILNVSLLALAAITLIGVLAAPWIAHFYASRLAGDELAIQQHAITFLLRLFIPQVVLYGLYFILAGVLNAHKRFAAPMFTPILNNFVVIGAFLFFHHLYGKVTLSDVTTPQLLLIGLGTTLSVAPMGLLLLPYLRKLGSYKLTLSLEHPSIRKLARLSVYVIGFVLANQLGFIVIQWLANEQRGGYSAFIAAQTFFLLPIGLFTWSLTTALMPSLSEHAVHERWDEYRERLSTGIRATTFLMLPAVAGYLILARPMIAVLLQHGVATEVSTDLVAAVLRFFVLGLLQFAVFQLLIRGFYALQDAKTPFYVNCVVVALNVAINIPMFTLLRVEGLAAGQGIAYSVGVVLLARLMAKRLGGLDGARIAISSARIAAATGMMAVVVWALARWFEEGLLGGDLFVQLALLALVVGAGAVVYLAGAHALHVEELDYVRSLVRSRTPAAVPGAETAPPAA
jgi:putative peptidoglycan lipid II flippase